MSKSAIRFLGGSKNFFAALAAGMTILALMLACARLLSPPAGQNLAARSGDWDRAFTQKEGWTGGDVAASFILPGNRALWVFGDSFIGEVENGRRVNSTLVNNAIALHPHDPAKPGAAPEPD